ncbi:MAG: hypothetical protein ACXAB7_21065, partial [Candidatus Kariarchaeaceae archaeon]
APFAVKFLSSLIENYTIDGVIFASFDKLVLFKENYTYGNFDVAIPLVMDIESILMDLIGEMLPGLIGGLVDVDALANASSTFPLSSISLFSMANPLPGMLSILGAAPALQQYAAQESEGDFLNDLIGGLINDLINSLFGGMLGSDMEFNLGLTVDPFPGQYTRFTISLTDFYVDDFFISVGLGATNMEVQGKNPNTQAWEKMIGLEIDDYFDIREQHREDISLTLTVYETEALCSFATTFIQDFFTANKSNILDLRMFGYMTLNLSGLFMPNLDIDFALEDLDLGLNGTELIDGIVDMIYTIDLDGGEAEPSLLNLWTGTVENVPFISQGIDLNALLYMGAISIMEISEEDYGGGLDQGKKAIVKIGMDVINYMMDINLNYFGISIYHEHPETTGTKILEVTIDDGPAGLPFGSSAHLNITVTIFKKTETETWINNLLKGFELDGWMNLSADVSVFQCNFTIRDTYIPAINLTCLPIDITSLLGAIMPLSAPFMNMVRGPLGAQDFDMDSIIGPDSNVMNFAIQKLSIGDYTEVGPLDYDNYMLDVGIDLLLQLMFNMSIKTLELELMDGDLYKALYVEGGHPFADVVREASIVKIEMVENEVYFDGVRPSTRGTTWVPDSNKPYLVNITNTEGPIANETEPWETEVAFLEDIDDVTSPPHSRSVMVDADTFNSTGFTDQNYLALQMPGLNNLSLRVGLYNKSHGTWGTKYPRQYWKNLGGPYFPVQVYGKEYGGFPDHYYVYHKYYAPLVSFMDKVIGLLTEEGMAADPDALNNLLSGIAIGGKVEVTMFDMDITIDLEHQINSLIEPIAGLFMGLTSLAINEYIDTVANPLKTAYQSPKEQEMEQVMSAQGIGDIFGDLLDLSSIPLELTEVLVGLTFPGIADRTDHAFNPKAKNQGGASRAWDGTAKWGDPWTVEEYSWDPEDMEGYTGGLDDPYFTGEPVAGTQYDGLTWINNWGITEFEPKEEFVKDYAYDWFKTVADNWAESVNLNNPFFETHYSVPVPGGSVYQAGEKIPDAADWPLLYSKGAFGGRAATGSITMHAAVLLTFPVSILSGRLTMWIEDPYNPCQYMPIGYVWMDSPVNLIDADTIFSDPGIQVYLDGAMPGFLTDNPEDVTWTEIKNAYAAHGMLADPILYPDQDDWQARVDIATMALGQAGTMGPYQIGNDGKPAEDGWVVIANIRLFEGLGSHEFLWGMISDNFNIHFLAQGELNVS